METSVTLQDVEIFQKEFEEMYSGFTEELYTHLRVFDSNFDGTFASSDRYVFTIQGLYRLMTHYIEMLKKEFNPDSVASNYKAIFNTSEAKNWKMFFKRFWFNERLDWEIYFNFLDKILQRIAIKILFFNDLKTLLFSRVEIKQVVKISFLESETKEKIYDFTEFINDGFELSALARNPINWFQEIFVLVPPDKNVDDFISLFGKQVLILYHDFMVVKSSEKFLTIIEEEIVCKNFFNMVQVKNYFVLLNTKEVTVIDSSNIYISSDKLKGLFEELDNIIGKSSGVILLNDIKRVTIKSYFHKWVENFSQIPFPTTNISSSQYWILANAKNQVKAKNQILEKEVKEGTRLFFEE